jgi:hypothetical protein
VKTHLLEDPTITRTLKHEDIALTGRNSAGEEIKVPAREFHIPEGPQPAPVKKSLRQRMVDGRLQFVEVTERPGERSIRGPDGVWRSESDHRMLKFTKGLGINEPWRVEADPDYKPSIRERVFRPGEDEDQGLRIPRPLVDKKGE